MFEYDGVYDALTSERRDTATRRREQREAEKKQPKYIASLLQKAKIRASENERIRERRLLHERQADDALYSDKEKLVSASYKRKLQEQRQWDDEDARLDALEDVEDVTKRGELAMAGFYANLLHKNLAMGGSTANATSAYTVRTTTADGDNNAGVNTTATATATAAADPTTRVETELESVEPSEKRRRTAATSELSTSLPLPAAPTAPQAAKPSKDETIAAAKARFLARKAQRATQAAPEGPPTH